MSRRLPPSRDSSSADSLMLRTADVTLVPIEVGDVSDEYVGWLNDPLTFRFLGTKFGQTPVKVRQYLEGIKPPNLLCKILSGSSAQHVGNIALRGFDAVHRNMELGIVIGVAEARGRGIGHQACSLLIQHAFDHLNVHKITAGTVDENEGMKQVFLDLGFRIEGTLAQHYYLEDRYHDVYRFGLLRDEFRPQLGVH
jgi:ribosomal-protein-alanine N-acetyltransferase